jgi:hypothetical protein
MAFEPLTDNKASVPEELRGLVDIVVNRLVKNILAGRLDDSPSPQQHGCDADVARRNARRARSVTGTSKLGGG